MWRPATRCRRKPPPRPHPGRGRSTEGGRPADPSRTCPDLRPGPGTPGPSRPCAATTGPSTSGRARPTRCGWTETCRRGPDRPADRALPAAPSGVPAGSAGGDRPVPTASAVVGRPTGGPAAPVLVDPAGAAVVGRHRPYGQSPAQQLPAHRRPGSPPLPAPRGRGIGPLHRVRGPGRAGHRRWRLGADLAGRGQLAVRPRDRGSTATARRSTARPGPVRALPAAAVDRVPESGRSSRRPTAPAARWWSTGTCWASTTGPPSRPPGRPAPPR